MKDLHPKLYLRAEHGGKDDDEFIMDMDTMGIFHYYEGDGSMLDLFYINYENEFGEEKYEWFSKVFNQQFPWIKEKLKLAESEHSEYRNWEEDRITSIAEKIYKKYFYMFPFDQPIDFLIKINEKEYIKLNEHICLIKKDKDDNNKHDDVEKAAFEEIIDRLEKFKKKFVHWFYRKNSEIPTTEVFEIKDDLLNISPLDRGDLTVKGLTELLVIEARRDKREGAHLVWKVKFFDEIGKISLYPTLGRIRDDFIEKYPKEKFNIHGMAWYNKS